MEKIIEIKKLMKKYKNNIILEDISLNIFQKDFIAIIGPNGSGKSTLAKIIAGLKKHNDGKIQRKFNNIGFVFQDYADSLLPWRNVYKNVCLPFEVSGNSEEDYREKVMEIIGEFNLEPHIEKYPFQLSGGLSQLTAIARALVNQPDLLILDEPFRSLDFNISRQIISHVIRYCEKKNITTILISHDIDQAVLFANKIVILSDSPAKIKKIIRIDLPRPRRIEMLESPSLLKIKKVVLEEFAR
jgi:NitT/TauT family transport system ATP-binding protein